MIIWGSRSKASTKESGRFYCPHCQGHRQYELKHSKQYFTLYFIQYFLISSEKERISIFGNNAQIWKIFLSKLLKLSYIGAHIIFLS